MRDITDFLNQLHYEERDFPKGLLTATPMQDAIENAKEAPLTQIVRDQVVGEKSPCETMFQFPESAERKPETEEEPDVTWIRYSVPNEQYELAREYFDLERPGDVGHKAFDYFFARELAD